MEKLHDIKYGKIFLTLCVFARDLLEDVTSGIRAKVATLTLFGFCKNEEQMYDAIGYNFRYDTNENYMETYAINYI